MEVNFELTLDDTGSPCIKFSHRETNSSLEQKTLSLFINQVKSRGCKLVNTGGFAGGGERVEKYEIKINKP